jgi:hypothetical protein
LWRLYRLLHLPKTSFGLYFTDPGIPRVPNSKRGKSKYPWFPYVKI